MSPRVGSCRPRVLASPVAAQNDGLVVFNTFCLSTDFPESNEHLKGTENPAFHMSTLPHSVPKAML